MSLAAKVAGAKAEIVDGAVPATRNTLADDLDRNAQRIAQVLPASMDVQRFKRIVLLEAMRTPKLTQCHPATVMGAVLNAAQLGLEPGPLGHVYMIPRWSKRKNCNEATLLIGYKGLIDLALRGGRVRSVDAHVVREHDTFDFAYGTDAHLSHRPAPRDRGEPLWAYAVAQLAEGGSVFRVLSVDDIAARRARGEGEGPWSTDWEAMAAKSAVRALAPYLPQSPLFAHAQRVDETVRTDLEHDLDELPDPQTDGEDHPNPATGAESGQTAKADATPEVSEGGGEESPAATAASLQEAPVAGLSPSEAIAHARSIASQVDLAELDAFCKAHGIPKNRGQWNAAQAALVIGWIEAG